jgi:uncharacterized membrane protein YfcA
MELWQMALLFGAALIAGGLNAVAGGGSFIAFPALLFVGIPPISANATTAVALWPGNAASVGAYRRELAGQGASLVHFGVLSLIGGLLGAMLLLRTEEAVFAGLIPYLMLGATIVFAIGPWLARLTRGMALGDGRGVRIAVFALYLAIAIYGGFFGAGLGILTLAVLALLGGENIHTMNALKTLQATLINGVAVLAFVLAGVVTWSAALVMVAGAIAGGYGGAALARRLNPQLVRIGVIIVSVGLTAIFFIRS